jgi:hypothetical protein
MRGEKRSVINGKIPVVKSIRNVQPPVLPDMDRVLPMIPAMPSNCSNGQLFTKPVLFRSLLTCLSQKTPTSRLGALSNSTAWEKIKLRYVADRWRMDYNHHRLHSLDASGDYMAPAAFAATCLGQGSATLHLPQDKENSCEILS